MLGLLKVPQQLSNSVIAWPELFRAAPAFSSSFGLFCTRHVATSAKACAVGDSTRSGSVDLFDRQAYQLFGSYVAPAAVTIC